MEIKFRERPQQGASKQFAVAVLNALTLDKGSVMFVGNVLDAAGYEQFAKQFASDEGTAVIYANTLKPAAFRQAVKTLAESLESPVVFFPRDAYIDGKWRIVGYRVEFGA